METLDECQGACLLKRPELSGIAADALLYFDGEYLRENAPKARLLTGEYRHYARP